MVAHPCLRRIQSLLISSLFFLSTFRQSSSATLPAIQLPRCSLTLSVADFGATGDGEHYDTEYIQAAVDACAEAGGGRVLFPPGGTYLTGTIFLRSGVVLEVAEGATVQGSAEENHYPMERSRWYVVLADNATDVGITGPGRIDGQGRAFVERLDPRKNVMKSWNRTGECLGDECRPRLLGFVDSANVRVWNINLVDPAYWCLHLSRCNGVLIEDVSIKGDFNTPNNDGIDVEDSNNTLITRCNIDTGDDAICPKSLTGPVHNLTATDCTIRTKSSAIKLGSASWYEFRNLVFDNITIVDSHRGLALQIRDGGNVSDITFSNVKIGTRYYDPSWWGRAEPIYVTSCRRDSSSGAGSISSLRFINITSVSENGVFLSGCKGGLLRDLKFVNVNLTYTRWTKYSGGLVDYRPGCRGLVNHRTAGFIMEHVSGLEAENVHMRWSESGPRGWNNPLDFRPSTVDKISLLDFHSDTYYN